MARFQELIRVQIQKSTIDLKSKWTSRENILSESDWLKMRNSRFKMREPVRFKITNYKPANDAFSALTQENDEKEFRLDLQLKKAFPNMNIDTIKLNDNTIEIVVEGRVFLIIGKYNLNS